jgi:hypothetical protein
MIGLVLAEISRSFDLKAGNPLPSRYKLLQGRL